MALVVKIEVVPDKDCRYGLHRAAMDATTRFASSGNSVDDLGMLVGSAVAGVVHSIDNGGDADRLHTAIGRAMPAALRTAFFVTPDDAMRDLLDENVEKAKQVVRLTAQLEAGDVILADRTKLAENAAAQAAETQAKQEKTIKAAKAKAKRQQAAIKERDQALKDTTPGAYSETAVRDALAEAVATSDAQCAAALRDAEEVTRQLITCRKHWQEAVAERDKLARSVQDTMLAWQKLNRASGTLRRANARLRQDNDKLRQGNKAEDTGPAVE